jgi:uncharacterized protein YdeI (YjbR/CyaY-like superfamily)
MEVEQVTRKDTSRPKTARRTVRVPADFKQALAGNTAAGTAFAAFSYSHKKEWVDWITQAKKSETRARQIAKAVSVLLEGK